MVVSWFAYGGFKGHLVVIVEWLSDLDEASAKLVLGMKDAIILSVAFARQISSHLVMKLVNTSS